MSQTLTYMIGQDRRPHVDNVQDFKVNFDGSNTNWVQARQYERSMRQVFVNIKNEDGTPLDLTGCNVWFEGLLPKNSAGDFRVIDDKGYVALDPTAGRFRFDMPGHAFTVAGSYRQAFFRILKDGNSITTLEFDLDVLADKVIDGLVPRTYISPVEELINEIEAKYQDSTDKLTKMTSDFVNQFTQSMNTLKALGVTVQNGLDALEQKIKQDDLFTQAEADAFKQAIVDQMAKLFEQAKAAVSDKQVATNMANFALAQGDNYTLSLPPYDQDSFTHATTVPHGESIVNVAFITDNHWQEDGNDIFDNSDGYAYHSLQHYQWFAEGTLTSKPDIVIADGDNVNGDDNRTSNIYTTRHVKAMLDSCYIKSSIFMIPGNHDLGIGQFDGSKKPGMVMSNDDLKSTYGTKPCRFGEVRNGDSLYFYKDLPDKKVRIIGLNSSDGPMTTGADGNYIWDAINVHVFSAEQLSWLVEKALVLPDTSWQVAIFFHAPIGKAFGGWDKESTSTINSDCLLDILTAFKNGTSTTCNSANSLAPITGLAADFTEQGKGTIIGIFNGHFHKDMQDLSTLNGTPMIETDASLTSQLNQARYNTINEDCWETISIDTAKRTIHCYRFGRGQDREFNY